jgi:hypothetical protein
LAAIILLVHVRGEIGLQDRRPEAAANETADSNLALPQIAINRARKVGRTEGDETGLPISKLSCGRQINVQEIWIAAVLGTLKLMMRGSRARTNQASDRLSLKVVEAAA